MFVLPISGAPVWFRTPEGVDELLLAESIGSPLHLRVEAARRLTPPMNAELNWDDLPYGDVDAALLALRQHITGDRLVAEVRCPYCIVWCDTALSVSAYLKANKPKRLANVNREPDGWYSWRDLRFRIPTVSAVLEAVSSVDAAAVLLEYSVSSSSSAKAVRAASLLERMAPPLAGMVRGTCPHCAQTVNGWFDPGSFVLAELRNKSSVVFEHVHILAQAYGWSEEAILALPSRRRSLYASRVEQERMN